MIDDINAKIGGSNSRSEYSFSEEYGEGQGKPEAPCRIILIGYMGSGKTTVGRALAADLGVPFYDLDWYIENRMRKTVSQIFAERGEEGFRAIEHNMLHEVAEFENVVISCGGGTPCFFDNMEYINSKAETVYLKSNSEVLFKHLKMGKTVRPLLLDKTAEEVKEFIQQQLKQREVYYTQAKHTVDVTLLDDHDKIKNTVAKLKEAVGLNR